MVQLVAALFTQFPVVHRIQHYGEKWNSIIQMRDWGLIGRFEWGVKCINIKHHRHTVTEYVLEHAVLCSTFTTITNTTWKT